MKLYINNLLVGTNPHTGGITSSSSRPLTAGSHYTGTRSVLGVVKDLKVYNKYIFENIEGLVAHYPFNGDANDFSENGNNGTTNGGVTWGTDRFNNSGQAAEFNGIDGYIEVPNSVSLQSPISSISISAWINIKQLVSTTWNCYNPQQREWTRILGILIYTGTSYSIIRCRIFRRTL